jgi:lysyl-tRNA synthetase class 2
MKKVYSDQENARRESLVALKELGIDPYPAATFDVNTTSKKIKETYNEGDELNVVIAGRLMSRRVMGKASFAELQDSYGRIQIYVNRDEICEEEDKTLYNKVFKKLLDIGDFIGIKGNVFTTRVGEISINVKELTVLAKALRPLPLPKSDADGTFHDAFTDPEKRYRQRYVDLVVNPHIKETFIQRLKLLTL